MAFLVRDIQTSKAAENRQRRNHAADSVPMCSWTFRRSYSNYDLNECVEGDLSCLAGWWHESDDIHQIHADYLLTKNLTFPKFFSINLPLPPSHHTLLTSHKVLPLTPAAAPRLIYIRGWVLGGSRKKINSPSPILNGWKVLNLASICHPSRLSRFRCLNKAKY